MKKVTLVTASTGGIGKAIGIKFLESGYYVIFNYAHNDNKKEECYNELLSRGFKTDSFCFIKADMASDEGIDSVVAEVKKICKDKILTTVVANLGYSGSKNRNKFGNISRAEWDNIININLAAPFFLVQAMRNYIMEGGNIILIGSAMGEYPHSTYIPYGVSKAGVHMLAKMLVKEFKQSNVRVNAIAPNFIMTEEFPGNRPQEQQESMLDKIASPSFGGVSDVADLCLSIVNNNYLNGQVIGLDGGYCYK